MKLTILQENLAKAVTQASRFTSTRSQLPILGNILLTAGKTKLTVSSTNLEISVSIKVGAKIEEEGDLSVPSKIISEIVTNLPKAQIDVESDKEQLKLSSPGFSSKILGTNSSDFPKIPDSVNKNKALSISKKLLIEALPKVLFAASMDETRPILTGVLFILAKTKLMLVATDGFRLSKKTINIESSRDGQVVIPKGILNELSKISGEEESLLFDIEDKEKQIILGGDDIVLTSRLLEGEYPDFEKIIPKSSLVSVLLDKEEFSRAVKLASIFARESANVVKLKIYKDFIKVIAESGSSGNQEAQVDAKVEGDVGKNFEVSFNFRFLEEFLHSANGEEIKIDFTTPDKAAVFTDTSDSSYLHLIMPVRIQG